LNLVHKWWDWCSESLSHTFAGVTAPLLIISAFFVVVFYASQGGDDGGPLPPRSDVAGVCVTSTTGGQECDAASTGVQVTTPTPVPPTPTPAPRSYTVQAGDTLSRICGNEAPDLSLDACVEAIVDLSDLEGPHEIFEGQTLKLPPGAAGSNGAATSTRRPAPTPTAVVVEPEPTLEPEPTEEVVAEPEPEATQEPQASLVAIGPADVAPDEDEAEAEPEATEEPEATPTAEELAESGGTEYEVEDGDSLLGICVNEVPDMDEEECMDFVVLLNDLDGPDEIRSGQEIILP
jgi:LysM repeat protein